MRTILQACPREKRENQVHLQPRRKRDGMKTSWRSSSPLQHLRAPSLLVRALELQARHTINLNLISLPSLGLTYFLTTVQQDDEGVRLVEQFLERSPGCEHVLAPLGWERDRRTYDVVGGQLSLEWLYFCCLAKEYLSIVMVPIFNLSCKSKDTLSDALHAYALCCRSSCVSVAWSRFSSTQPPPPPPPPLILSTLPSSSATPPATSWF